MTEPEPTTPRWRRILLKLSGEAFAGDGEFGIDSKVLERVASDIIDVRSNLGVEVAVVVGGGNFWRGLAGARPFMTVASMPM